MVRIGLWWGPKLPVVLHLYPGTQSIHEVSGLKLALVMYQGVDWTGYQGSFAHPLMGT